jgi:colanic acid/amylovoran biosynthesis glycosyltransferase
VTAGSAASGRVPERRTAVGRRIAYVLSLFPCYDETFILREIKGLAERGVRLRIFSLRRRKDPVIQDDALPFIPLTRYASFLFSGEVLAAVARVILGRPRPLLELVAALFAECWRRPRTLLKSLAFLPKAILFAEVARREGVEHIHAHWASYPATAALLMSRLSGISWSFTCHAHDIFLDPSLLARKIESAEFALTCTADNKRHLETVTQAAVRKVRVSYHGLDLRSFKPRARTNAPARPEVLGVGSLLECKGFDLLIEAAALLRRRGLDFHVTIAGGGPEEARLRADITRHGLEGVVELTGYLTQKDLVPLYQSADLFVLPAVLEIHWGIPNVLVEALACHVPVITTALPSLPELVEDGVQGLVARNRDPEDLAAKMERLLGDAAAREAMGLSGRKRVEALFDIEKTIDTVLEPLAERLDVAS